MQSEQVAEQRDGWTAHGGANAQNYGPAATLLHVRRLTTDGRLAADIRPVHQHAVVTGSSYTYRGRTYRRSSHDRSTSRSARNAGHAHRRPGPADPGLRTTCGQ